MIKDVKSGIAGSDDENAFAIIITWVAKFSSMHDFALETFEAGPRWYDWFAVSARCDNDVPGRDRPFVRREPINALTNRYVIDLDPKFDWHRFFGNEVFKVGDHGIALWKSWGSCWIPHAWQVGKIPVSIERELRMPRTPLITNAASLLEYPWVNSNLPQFESGDQTSRTSPHDYGGFSLICLYHDISS
ncbi:hypothetical protein AOG23_32130 [Rhizobium acidisoli]|nr:hypothetical protein AOG23_32130 [Rhizobium acidisoli]